MSNTEPAPDRWHDQEAPRDPPMQIVCTRCFHTLNVKRGDGGKKYKCPKCFNVLRVPETFDRN